MIQISEVSIISVDQGDIDWTIEGEILFEEDLTSPFSVTYITEDDEFEDLIMEIDPGKYDKRLLKKMILEAVKDFED